MKSGQSPRRKRFGMLRSAISGASLVVLVVARGSSMADAAPAAVSQIVIQNLKFAPATVTVPVGTTVTWSNQDDQIHTVTTDDGRLRSAALSHEQQFSYTFAAPGTYAYHCALHPHMTARIIVK
jgi:plastocyanin